MSDPNRRDFETHFKTLALDDATLKARGEETIVPDDGRGADIATVDSLPRLHFDDEAPAETSPDFQVLGTLGEGGMGLVRLARQIPLDRDVAVKTLLRLDDEARTSLLKEAYVTGHLEHPNIVPIYTLGRDAEGAPIIIMKRIEGTSWLSLLRERKDPHQDLERHLEILLQVSNALRFAHARGVVHRDIKPENVMIGNFGEVYLLDWGIAISLKESRTLPGREQAQGVAGTPAYMAPEMTRDDAAEVDFRTDIYLLGSTLHEVLTGRTRHEGDSLFDMMYSAFRSDPYDYAEEIPEELGEIANRACAARPEDRYESVEAFRSDLHDYLDHRESLEVAREADERLSGLRAEIEAEERDDARVHDLFGECRFGFEQSLRMWPQNELATRGRAHGLRLMTRYYIDEKNLAAARSVFTDLDEESPELEKALDELEKELGARREEIQQLEQFARESDLRTAATSRSIIAVLLGILWFGTALSGALTQAPLSAPNDVLIENHFKFILRTVGIAVVVIFLFRKKVFRNRANRRLMYMLMAMLLMMFMMRLSFVLLGDVDITTARVAETMIYAFAVIAVALVSHLRIIWLSIFYLSAALLGALLPEYHLYFVAAANLLTFLGFAWFWHPSRMDREAQAS